VPIKDGAFQHPIDMGDMTGMSCTECHTGKGLNQSSNVSKAEGASLSPDVMSQTAVTTVPVRPSSRFASWR
jgi:hypothetical protein